MTTAKNTALENPMLPFIICGLASLFYVYDYFIQVSPAVITQQLMASFSIGAAGIGILGSCFFYAYALMQIPAGFLLDKYGARRLLSLAILVSGLGVTMFGMTHSFTLSALTRLMVGFGSAFSFIGALYLVSRWFPHRHFALLAGIVQFSGCVGSMIGEAPLALTIDHYGWRQTMIATGFITLILSIIFWLVIRDNKPGTQLDKQHSDISIRDRLSLILGTPQVWWVMLCGFFCWVPVASIGALWGVPYLMKVYGWQNIHAAAICSLFWLGLGLGSPILGWLSDRLRTRKLPFILCFSLALIASIIIIQAPHFSSWVISIAMILLGVSASIQTLTFSLIKDILPSKVFGTAAGFTNMAAILGGGIAQLSIGVLLTIFWQGTYANNIPVYSLTNYRFALIILPIAAAAGLMITLIKLKETHCQQHSFSMEGLQNSLR